MKKLIKKLFVVLLILIIIVILGSIFKYKNDNKKEREQAIAELATMSVENTSDIEDATIKTTKETAKNNIRKDIKEFLDSYENFMNEYCDFMEKYSKNKDTSMLNDFTEYTKKYSDFTEKFDAINDKDLNDSELEYYIEVQNKVNKRLLKISK